jgi:hypothetical protein
MATIPNALLLGASSPYARRGVLWDNYHLYFGNPEASLGQAPLVWQAPTRVMNPTIPQSYIDEKYQLDPLAAAAEYGAEFRSDVDVFVTEDVINDAIARHVHEHLPAPGIRYRAFVDPSGGSSDSFTLAIGHLDNKTRHTHIDAIREVKPPFSPDRVVSEFANFLKSYRISAVVGDYYAGEWPTDAFRRNGIHYEVSKKKKSEIYLEFLPILNASRVTLLDNTRLITQLLQLERRTTRGGSEIIDHPPGAHDDVANAVAGVAVFVQKSAALPIDNWVLRRAHTLYRPPYPLLDDLRRFG